MSTSNTLIIGSGRLARHLKYWSNLNSENNHLRPTTKHNLHYWDRSKPTQLLSSLVDSATHIWLAISDHAIVPFYEHHLVHKTKAQIVHFSGALYDPRISGAHPLMSFPDELLPQDIYNKIYFAVDDSMRTLQQLMPGFSNSNFQIPAEKKSLYHALCVASGNFPQILWSLCLQPFKDIEVPDQAIEIYLKQIADNFIAHKNGALTGPLVRKDLITIERNISALQNNKNASQIVELYKTFVGVYQK
jgi:2-dehydropantoate 2-reductase